MKIRDEESRTFRHAGTVLWESTSGTLRWSWESDIPWGYVVYLMVVGQDVKKAGKAEDTTSSTFKKRMQSEFATVRQVISGPVPGRPLAQWRLKPLDPFKKYAAPALLTGCTVELWARALQSKQAMLDEEYRLNETQYRGEWTKEGWTRDGRRRLPEGADTTELPEARDRSRD